MTPTHSKARITRFKRGSMQTRLPRKAAEMVARLAAENARGRK